MTVLILVSGERVRENGEWRMENGETQFGVMLVTCSSYISNTSLVNDFWLVKSINDFWLVKSIFEKLIWPKYYIGLF